MEERGFSVERQRYSMEGEARPLVCDVFLPELLLLIEAKAQENRNSIRLAVGQLMDYRRFVDKPRLAILLPHEPAPRSPEPAAEHRCGVDLAGPTRSLP